MAVQDSKAHQVYRANEGSLAFRGKQEGLVTRESQVFLGYLDPRGHQVKRDPLAFEGNQGYLGKMGIREKKEAEDLGGHLAILALVDTPGSTGRTERQEVTAERGKLGSQGTPVWKDGRDTPACLVYQGMKAGVD